VTSIDEATDRRCEGGGRSSDGVLSAFVPKRSEKKHCQIPMLVTLIFVIKHAFLLSIFIG